MRSRVAALVAVCFATAVSAPQVGVVVHRHAGGDLPHVHLGLDEDAPPHHHDHDDAGDDDHDHQEPAPAGPGIRAGSAGWEWHSHATRPFHRAARSARTALPSPRPVARLIVAAPHERVGADPISLRSRGPPPASS